MNINRKGYSIEKTVHKAIVDCLITKIMPAFMSTHRYAIKVITIVKKL